MENIGWEVRPVGWILLVILVALLLYCIWSRLKHPSDKNQ